MSGIYCGGYAIHIQAKKLISHWDHNTRKPEFSIIANTLSNILMKTFLVNAKETVRPILFVKMVRKPFDRFCCKI